MAEAIDTFRKYDETFEVNEEHLLRVSGNTEETDREATNRKYKTKKTRVHPPLRGGDRVAAARAV